VVKNKEEWLKSREKLKERKEGEAKNSQASDESAAFGLPMEGFKEQIERLLGTTRRKREDA
jgi:hypothetical protein